MLGLSTLVVPSVICLISYAIYQHTRRPTAPYPPGPAPKPIIGNLLDIPFTGKPWLRYLEWSKKIRHDIVHMHALGLHVVVLHKLEDAVALLEKRSAVYSNRRDFPISDMLGVEFGTPLLAYGDRWRTHRRIFNDHFKKEKLPSYERVITEKVHILLGEFLREPANLEDHTKWLSGSTILAFSFAYDLRPGDRHNRIVEAAEFADQLFLQLSVPGRTLIDVIPFLKYIPPWVPGAYTQRLGAESKRLVGQYKTELFGHVEKNMASGRVEGSILADLLQSRAEQDGVAYDDDTLKDVMGTMYLAGVETVSSATITLVFSLVLHPEAQKKAQAEIDRVVGTGRLPTFDDRESLPYVEALLREILRWRPVTPLALPHTTIKDDVYNGFFIPEGTMVIANFWAMSRDETKYPEPERFTPERFFNTDGSLNGDIVEYAFGFGRRVCPGKHVADSILWLTLACLLSVFNISKAKDDNGHETEIDDEAFLESFVTHPLPFKYSIIPRSQQAEALIRSSAMGDANGA